MIPKKCRYTGCPEKTFDASGYCEKHRTEMKRTRQTIDYRNNPEKAERRHNSETQRGYDHAWQVFARKFLAEHPTCAICGRPATVCDHKVMTAQVMLDMYGRFDLNPDLYQALCTSCNNRKRKQDMRQIQNFKKEQKEILDNMEDIYF